MCLNYWVMIIKQKKSAQPIRTQHLNLIKIKKNRDKTSTYVHALTFSAQSEGDAT